MYCTGTLAGMTETFIMWLFNNTCIHCLLNLYMCTVRSSSDRKGSTARFCDYGERIASLTHAM